MDYPEGFESLWAARPRRDGGDPKLGAFKKWKARIKDGHTAEDIYAGLVRYRSWCEAKGKIGTEFVMQLQTFLGPDEHFTNLWQAGIARQAQTKDRTVSQQLSDRSWADDCRNGIGDASWAIGVGDKPGA